MQLVHHRLAVGIPQLLAVVDAHQCHGRLAALRCTLFQLLGKHRFQIAAVVHAGKEIVAHILAAQFPLPGCHALFRQHIACQRCAHFQLPAFAVRFHSAVQHTVHTAIAQLVVHPQAIVLPAVTKRCFGQGHCLKYGLR